MAKVPNGAGCVHGMLEVSGHTLLELCESGSFESVSHWVPGELFVAFGA